MKKFLMTAALIVFATPAMAKEYTVKMVSDPGEDKPYYFNPANLTIQPGDTVTFINAQDDTHNVMVDGAPQAMKDMIMSPMLEVEDDKWSYKFTVPGTYSFHCHPHQELGMKGTIIVGTASKSGETRVMDHGHMEGMGHH